MRPSRFKSALRLSAAGSNNWRRRTARSASPTTPSPSKSAASLGAVGDALGLRVRVGVAVAVNETVALGDSVGDGE